MGSLSISPRTSPVPHHPADTVSSGLTKATDIKTREVAARILHGAGVIIGAAAICGAFFVSLSYAWGLALAITCYMIGERLLVLPKPIAPPSVTAKKVDKAAKAPASSSRSSYASYAPATASESPRTSFVEGQPVGIRNSSCNCWVNALAQFAHHIPSLRQVVQTDGNLAAFRHFDAAYERAQQQRGQVAGGADSQTLRMCLRRLNRNLSSQARSQEDAHEGLITMMGNCVPNPIRWIRADRDIDEPTHIISINIDNHQNRTIDQLLEQDFLTRRDTGGGALGYFHTRPTEFFFHIARFQHTVRGAYRKNTEAIAIDPQFTLHPRHVLTGEGGQYTCDAFISHLGRSMKGGHYVAHIHVGDQWWLCNDSRITRASVAEVDRARRTAYIVHYTQET